MSDSWQTFWSGTHRIYVNQRHLEAHYQRLAEDLIELLDGAPGKVLLDWGCGDALASPALAAAGFDVRLYDAVPAVQARVVARFRDAAGIVVLDDDAWAAQPPAGIDVILVNSVLQYLPREALDGLLRRWRDLLRPGGWLLLADVIPPDSSLAADVAALLRAAARHRFLRAAVVGLAATFFSDYRRLRRRLGLTRWAESELLTRLRSSGYAAERLPRNPGISPHRMLVRAVRPLGAAPDQERISSPD